MILEKYSIGLGDRFAHQAKAQLKAVIKAQAQGIELVPVWNKSHREHTIIGTKPESARLQADRAVEELKWSGAYYVDADHISLATVDAFIDAADYYTLDVAEQIGRPAAEPAITEFVRAFEGWIGQVALPGGGEISLEPAQLEATARHYLAAAIEAGRIYQHIAARLGPEGFITEVSIDETDRPQTPAELFVILGALAREGVPVQVIAPKFTGRFNKGVDYVGNVDKFADEFEQHLKVVALAVEAFELPPSLKLSIHSGSDKFSIYPAINRLIRKYDAGLHVKTAGTTWLEELIGLAQAGNDGLALVKEVYGQALQRFDALCAPYSAVIEVDRTALPTAEEVKLWESERFLRALRHDTACNDYNPHLRQLLHVGYKVAAEMGDRYLRMLEQAESAVESTVTHNIFERHIVPLFAGVAAVCESGPGIYK